ncbi:nucleotide pyrophosphohydrolase [Uliginosibacterium gangwonense]|uniref:nucleotide pyrophosphohydrolase n=1 Tax=Uliginosibacterium gangwonense TaxID=392736 RepID=UPI0003626447|nr:nucleotide pyrophosphohydrolase [Uliginosibacterium gangwonense]
MATPSESAGSPRLLDTHALEARLAEFARERDWDRFHTPRNILLALTGEVGELAEIFQWLTDEEAESIMRTDKAEHVRQEISDVLLYLMRLAMILEIDLDSAVRNKIAMNAVKYPPIPKDQ